MYEVKKSWKTFNISLSELADQLKLDFPEHETNTVFDSLDARPDGIVGEEVLYTGFITMRFNQELTEGELETLETLWDSIDEAHIIATSYVSATSLQEAEIRAREDAPTKTWDNLTIEQKKIISGAEITLTDRKQMLTDFPEAV